MARRNVALDLRARAPGPQLQAARPHADHARARTAPLSAAHAQNAPVGPIAQVAVLRDHPTRAEVSRARSYEVAVNS